ncbi:TrbI/VirB10 family protein [Vibrio cholerae]|nr:TrbI/VirB10 family protein [Vibrio cholerae]
MDNETSQVEESRNQTHSTPNEQSPEYKKKMSLFIKMSFGVICLMFFLWILADKMKSSISQENSSNSNTPSTTLEVTQESAPTDVTQETFEKIVKERSKAVDVSDVSVTQQVKEDLKGAVTDAMAGTSVQSEKERNAALEYKRAALSSRAAWSLKPVQSPFVSSTTLAKTNTDVVTSTSDEMLSTEDQRRMVAERLKKMEQLKQNIIAGNYSPHEQSAAQTNVASLESSFSLPPSDIVGYTSENIYQASTEGMLKLPIGSIIPAISIMKADSDRTGTFKGMVTQDIFDVDYEYVLIPKGSELIFKSYKLSTANEVINSYVGYSVPWLILPNGNKIDMTKSSGLDRQGLTGLSDQVDRHLMAQFLGVAAYALVANNSSYEGSGANSDNSYAGEVSEGLRDQIAPEVQKYLQLRPTNTIRTGQSMNVIIEDEIYLKPWKSIYEDYL